MCWFGPLSEASLSNSVSCGSEHVTQRETVWWICPQSRDEFYLHNHRVFYLCSVGVINTSLKIKIYLKLKPGIILLTAVGMIAGKIVQGLKQLGLGSEMSISSNASIALTNV